MPDNKKIIAAFVEPIGGHRGNDFYDFGLCKALHDCGVNISFYTCDENSLGDKFAFGFETIKCFRKIYGKDFILIRGWRYLRGALAAVADAKKKNASLVHLHIYHFSWREFFVLWLFRRNKFKVVATIHDVEDFEKYGSEMRTSKYRKFERRIDRVIVHSGYAKHSIEKYFPDFPSSHIHHSPHGDSDFLYSADCTSAEARQKLSLLTDKKLILFFGQIKKVKGLDILLRAFALVRQKNKNVQLVIAGPPWKVEQEEFDKLISENRMEADCILRMSYIESELIPFYFKATDVVALPYRKIYSSGVLIRSLDYASAIVASDLDVFKSVIDDGVNGILFQTENPEDLAEKILSMIDNSSLLEKLRVAAKKTADEKFGWKLIGEKVKEVYSLAAHP